MAPMDNVTPTKIATLIGQALRCTPSLEGDSYTFEPRFDGIRMLPVSSSDLDEIALRVNQLQPLGATAAVTENSYEVVVSIDTRLPLRAFFGPNGDQIEVADQQSDLSYRLGSPSPQFAIFIIMGMAEKVGPRWIRNVGLHPSGRLRAAPQEPRDVMTAFQSALRFRTLHLTSSKKRSEAFWKPHADSFFFHLGYNLDLPVMPMPDLSELVERSRIAGMRRSGINDLDPPRRQYVTDLVHHYQLGISAESAMLKYLSYYHVAEHWFENVYQDDLAGKVQQLVTSPEFSYRRKQDIKRLIKEVSKAIQVRDDDLVINELTALRLTLERYVDLVRLRDELTRFDSELVALYATRVVGFSSGDTFDLSRPDAPDTVAALSRRIYKTRNALVHSKEGAKGRFIPFANDADLMNEVPLMRFVAEQILIATSKIAHMP